MQTDLAGAFVSPLSRRARSILCLYSVSAAAARVFSKITQSTANESVLTVLVVIFNAFSS
jgi:hypothetical protein